MTDALKVELIPADNMELADLRIWITDDRGGIIHEEYIDKKALREILEDGEGAVKVRIDAAGDWQTLHAQAQDEAGHRSIGMMAAAGSGQYPDLTAAVDAYVTLSGTVAPQDPPEALERRFALYRRMAELNRDYGVHAAL